MLLLLNSGVLYGRGEVVRWCIEISDVVYSREESLVMLCCSVGIIPVAGPVGVGGKKSKLLTNDVTFTYYVLKHGRPLRSRIAVTLPILYHQVGDYLGS